MAENPTTEPRKRSTSTMPTSQFDLLDLAEFVAQRWEDSPKIQLIWIAAPEFTRMVQEFKIALNERVDAGSGRKSQTLTLKNLDAELNKAIDALKIAIQYKFGKETGKAMFEEFGIYKVFSGYKLPTDRNARLNALRVTVKGVEKHKITLTDYTADYFQKTLAAYDALLNQTKTTDSAVAEGVSDKNQLMLQIKRVLNALILIIKGNYPDTYSAELRAWGFQKEKY